MVIRSVPGSWKPKFVNGSWQVLDKDGRLIASIGKNKNARAYAQLIASSPYLFEALKGVVDLIGNEDLPDNGELSGAAICDMARAAVELAVGTKK